MTEAKGKILHVLSEGINAVRDSRHVSINLFADTCGISAGAFKSYLYGKNLLSIETLISICNCYQVSVNTIFGALIDFQTEMNTIQNILNSFNKLPTEKQGRVYAIIAPLVEKMVHGNPNLEKASFATKLRVCREDCCVSESSFCKLCSISENTLKAYEFSQRLPGIENFLKICKVLNVSPEYMLCNEFNDSYPFCCDKRFYSLTPLELSAVATASARLCGYLEN